MTTLNSLFTNTTLAVFGDSEGYASWAFLMPFPHSTLMEPHGKYSKPQIKFQILISKYTAESKAQWKMHCF